MRVDPGAIILLVEDNSDDVDLTLRALRKNGIDNRVIVASNGQQALDYLFGTGEYSDKPHPPPRVILLDLNLPGLGGLDVLQTLRSDERTRFIPVVILTSSSEERDLVRGYELGANSYVFKPVDFTHFIEVARALGLYWLTFNVTATATKV